MKLSTFNSRTSLNVDYVIKRFNLLRVPNRSTSDFHVICLIADQFIDGNVWKYLTNMPGISYQFQSLDGSPCIVIYAPKSKSER